MKALQQPAFIIHSRPYRESSFIVELFSRDHGRVACVARGARRGKRGTGVPQPFSPLLASWVGRGPLFTMTEAEVTPVAGGKFVAGAKFVAGSGRLAGDHLVGGLYMNELIMRLLEPGDVHRRLFEGYTLTLAGLAEQAPMSVILREFEYLLLRECGYAPDFTRCAATGQAISAGGRYKLVIDEGFSRLPDEGSPAGTDPAGSYEGSALLAIAAGDYAMRAHRRAALHIFRRLLDGHIGERGLTSRSLLSSGRDG